jgi:outer membrane protein assembly factor BamB
MKRLLPIACALFVLCLDAHGDHRVLLQGNGRLAIIEPDGSISWEMPFGMLHDLHVIDGGYIVTVQDWTKVVAIDPESKEVVWSYDASNDNGGNHIEVHAAQPIGNDRVLIAESGAGRLIEVDRSGKIQKSIPLTLDAPNPHRDTRLARKLDNGHYLVCHEIDGVVREYDGDGTVVWEFPVPLFGHERADGHGPEAFGNQTFGAIRLPNGNTLVGTGNGHAIVEVTPEKDIVWELHQNDLPGITLGWVTTLELLPNGHLVFGNGYAGPGQPQLIEIDRNTKEVVWKLERYDDFGNEVTNSVLLDLVGHTIR